MVAIKCRACLRKDSSDTKKQPDCANCPNPEIKFSDEKYIEIKETTKEVWEKKQ